MKFGKHEIILLKFDCFFRAFGLSCFRDPNFKINLPDSLFSRDFNPKKDAVKCRNIVKRK